MNALPRIALVLLLASPVPGAGQSPPRGASDRAAVIASLPRGVAFTSGGERYRMLGGVRALHRVAHESEAQALARAGASAGDVIERKGRAYLVVRSPAAAAGTVPRVGHLAALNARTGQLAVVSGILEVHVRRGTDPAALAFGYGLAVVSSAPRLAVTFLRVPAGRDLPAAAAELERDPQVEGVEIEVLEHVNVPR